jgi:MOSC domain-containing protein YiiM
MPTPDSKAHGLVDTAIAAVGDEHVDLGQHPFERQVLGKARIARNWAGYGVDEAPTRSGDYEQIRLVRERRERRADQQSEIVIG